MRTSRSGARSRSVEAFRQRARAFIRANLQPSSASDSIGVLRPRRSDEEELASVALERELQRKLFDAGLAGICFPKEYGGQGLTPAHQARAQGGDGRLRVPVPGAGPDDVAVRRGAAGVRHRGPEAGPPARDPAGRGAVDAVPLRAQRRVRRRRGPHHGGAGRRRVGAQRLQGVDHRRLVVRLGPLPGPHQLGRPQAPWPDGLHPAHPPARHRGAPHRDAQRHQGVLPGVHHRRAGPGHRPGRRGRRRLDGGHPVDGPRADASAARPM